MMAIEEVRKGLDHHAHLEESRENLNFDECFDCPYRPDGKDACDSLQPLLKDALALLTPETPRVMTTDEVKTLKPGDSCWLEVWWEEGGKTGSTIEFCVVAPDWHLYSESSITPLRELKTVLKANYKERFWSLKPTKEEREATPWES